MEILCDGLDLSNAILIVSKATTNKTPNSILEGIKVKAIGDKVELSATDAELSIITSIKAEVYKEGEVVIPGNFFGNYLKRLTNEQIKLTQVENQLKVSYSDSEGFIQCYNVNEFPKIQQIENQDYFEIGLIKGLRHIAFSDFEKLGDGFKTVIPPCSVVKFVIR